ncbi:PstC family ABC transporter permease [Desulforhopalus singaporensis]|uniref:Phosphate ABC transporter membrane protein 1, PhoT family n=1 Tax=Desulforhopalus singaporensis TaxID=91360 RepID=A0A1H0URF1_9BACT|nr:ABC transporter permease subunit [Desulforhopalus singaporensis]SDP68744.1 phosphate ABC transporter membrane protein 1, PhoT family [Desulforhopalus singaporensis]
MGVLFQLAAYGCGLLTIAVLVMMFQLGRPLFVDGQFFSLLSQVWQPGQQLYGIYPMIIGSIRISFLALALSFPVSLGTAFLAAGLAPRPMQRWVLAMVRLMAGIPTVVYGFVAIFLLVPLVREHVSRGSGLNILTASLVLAVLIAPTMVVFFVNGLRGVDQSYCRATDALGATAVQRLLYLQLPQGWPTIVSGVIMGLGRAMGDTLVSLMVAGNSIGVPTSIVDSARTLTAHIALVIAADFASMEFASIFACGLVLYLFTMAVVIGLRMLVHLRTGSDR